MSLPRLHARVAPWAGLLGTILLAVSAWLLWPRPDPSAVPTGAPLRALLVDASASVTRLRPGYGSWLRRALLDQARSAAEQGEDLLVIVFGAEVATRFGPGPAREFEQRLLGRDGDPWQAVLPVGRDLESDLAGALRVAAAALAEAERAPGRLWLTGDGMWTTTDPLPALVAAVRDGVRVSHLEPPALQTADLALSRLDLPARVEEGADVDFAAHFEARLPPSMDTTVGQASVRVEARLAGGGREMRLSGDLVLPALSRLGDRAVASGCWRGRFPAPAPGTYLLEVHGALVAGDGGRQKDRVPENDGLASATRVEGRIHAVVSTSESVRAELAAWLASAAIAWPGTQLEVLEPSELVGRLSAADLLLTVDLGPAALPELAVEDFVRRGGRWLALGGWRALSGWTAGPTGADHPAELGIRLQDLLPIEPDPRDSDPRDVVLLVDRSGSMVGEPFDRVRAALAELVLAAPASDRIELRFFWETLGPVAFESPRGQSAAQRGRGVGALLSATAPTGSTDILDSLERLLAVRAGAREPALVLLLTDGRTRDVPADRVRALRSALARGSIELRSIAVGRRATLEFLDLLCLPGEAVERCEDLDRLAFLLTRELYEERVRRAPDLAVVPVSAGEGAAGDWERDLLGAWRPDFDRPASLAVLARGRFAPDAAPLLVTSDGDPVLAVRRHGRGRVASSTTSPAYGWAPFLDDPDRLAPLIRALGRPEEAAEDGPRLTFEDDRAVLQGAAPDWPAGIVLELHRPELPGSPPTDRPAFGSSWLTIPERGRGGDPRGRREGPRPRELDLRAAGTPVQALVRDQERILASLTVGAPVPRELGPGAPGGLEALLARLGALQPGLQEPGGQVREARPGAVAVLVLALVLLFLSALPIVPGSQAGEPNGRQ